MKRGIVVSLLFMGPFLSFSQETQIPLQHEVEVVLKLVKVYVVDQYDMPVLDLNQEDFRLYVNNKEVDIVAFEKHFSSLKTKKLDAAIRPHQIIPQVRDEGRNFIFFFDYFMNDIKGIKDSKKMALDFINNQI
ncbi:MAG: hypothetical protein L6425_04765, partial [Candidatus Aminicenantes bacterium]|nr:hypothetical protein [Candidatus Aminicenantes bacterium]